MIILMDEDGTVTTADDIEDLSPCSWPVAVKIEMDKEGRLIAFDRGIDGSWKEVTNDAHT